MPVVLDRHFFVRNGSSAKFFFTVSRVPFIRKIDPDKTCRPAPLFSPAIMRCRVTVRSDERKNIFI
jgi:hypothetical protein